MDAQITNYSNKTLRAEVQQQVIDFMCQEVAIRCTPDNGVTVLHGTDSVENECGRFECNAFNEVSDVGRACQAPLMITCEETCYTPVLATTDNCGCPAYRVCVLGSVSCCLKFST